MINRRKALKSLGLGALSVTTMMASHPSKSSNEADIKKKPILRIAHLTDMHVFPDSPAEEGVKKCIEHALNHHGKINFFINGGDIIMDALNENKEKVEEQWKVWRRIKADYPDLKIYHCLGNHDVWGLTPDLETFPGKAWALKEHNMDCPYYNFETNGWHFIVLDSTIQKADKTWYTAKLDTTQRLWLENKLTTLPADAPIMVISHIPILGATPFLDGDNAKTGDWIVPGAWMHTDAKSLVNLFYKHKNVKVCISGHIHLVESLKYHDITYHCSGAVSGNWWKNEPYELTQKGYAIIELFDDGNHNYKYVEYDY